MQTSLLSVGHYFLTFIDDNTRYVWVYSSKNKSEVYEKFVEWKALVENSTEQKLKPFVLTTEESTHLQNSPCI